MSPADKLRKVADFVAGLKPSLFYMGTWMSTRDAKGRLLGLGDEKLEPKDILNAAMMGSPCKTTACFLGWATVVLPKDLCMMADCYGNWVVETRSRTLEDDYFPTVSSGGPAGANVFSLTGEEAAKLFSFAGHAESSTPKEVQAEVVRRAREFADNVDRRAHECTQAS